MALLLDFLLTLDLPRTHHTRNGLLLAMRRQKPSHDNRDTSAVKPVIQPQSRIPCIRRDITESFSKAVAQPGQYQNRSNRNWITVAFQASKLAFALDELSTQIQMGRETGYQ
jgi:hypothetical protein